MYFSDDKNSSKVPINFAFSLKILGSDGASIILELAAESEEEANDWIVNICQVVADSVRCKSFFRFYSVRSDFI